MKNYKIYIAILFSSVLFTLYLFETYLTVNSNQAEVNKVKIKENFEKKNAKDYETRSKYQFFKDLSNNNKNFTVTVSPAKFNDPKRNIHFLSGTSNSKTIDCNENGYFSIYLSDRFGFNNPNDQWEGEDIKYILLGDSFVHGACVNRPNDIASQLRVLSNKKVINLGYKANGPLSMLATLKEYMPKNTENVLWVYFEGNDLNDLEFELNNKILIKYYSNINFKQNLKKKQKIINLLNKKILFKSIDLEDRIIDQASRNARLKNKLLKFIRLNETKKVLNLKKIKQTEKKLPIKEFKNIIKNAKKYVENNNSKLHFVYLPQFERYNNNVLNSNYDEIKQIIGELDINFIDIHKGVFLKHKDPLELFPFKMWGHYNENGYKKVSSYIYENLKQYGN